MIDVDWRRDLVPSLYIITATILIYAHNSFEEFDGAWQLFAGRRLIVTGEYTGWGSHFWPPMYSFLIGISDLVLPGFLAGKLVSATAAVGILYVVYYFANSIFSYDYSGTISQGLVTSHPLFITRSFIVENHIVDAFFVLISLYFLYQYTQNNQTQPLVIAAIFGGIASLTRHTSLILGPVSILLIISTVLKFKRGNEADIVYSVLKSSVLFTGCFFIIQSPWLIYNLFENGSPLHTWQYMNIGSAVVPTETWWWKDQSNYMGVFDIIRNHPATYLKNFLSNIIISGYYVLRNSGPLSIIYIIVLLDSFKHWRMSRNLILLLFGSGFTILVSQGFVSPWFFIHLSMLFTVLSVGVLLRDENIPSYITKINKYNIVVVIIALNVIISAAMVGAYLEGAERDDGQMVESEKIGSELERYDSNIGNKYVMAVNPAQSYYTSANHIQFPFENIGNLTTVTCYTGINGSAEEYAYSLAIPPAEPEEEISADYIILNPWAENKFPEYEYLFDPNNSSTPKGFTTVYSSNEVIVYDIQKFTERRC
jgi:hypothetical protein